jgi:hypothetical protein
MEDKQPGLDERRGIHLLSPDDLVRWRGDLWDVTGVFLSTDRKGSTVTMTAVDDMSKTELRLPLSIVEDACTVYLKAVKP